MDASPRFRADIVAALPKLRGYASRLRRGREVEDLVQSTVERALANVALFEPGTALTPWLYIMMRNIFISEWRRTVTRERTDHDARLARASPPAQEFHVEIREISAILDRLTPDRRNALLAIAVHRMTYDEAAAALDCASGTVKSRVHRARLDLAELLRPRPGHT